MFKTVAIALLVALVAGVFLLIGMFLGGGTSGTGEAGGTVVISGEAMAIVGVVFLAIVVGGVLWGLDFGRLSAEVRAGCARRVPPGLPG